MKKTLVVGASTNPNRYSYIATIDLKKHGHEVVALGLRVGNIEGTPIVTGKPEVTDLDTVTMYVGPDGQSPLYEYIIGLNPKRVIFNPGAENPEFEEMLEAKGIVVDEACTLVLLHTHRY